MASATPWIVDTLIDAIDTYLALESERKDPEQIGGIPFKYTRSIGRLSIRIDKEPNATLRLINWNVSPSRKAVKALVTDGRVTTNVILSQTGVDTARHSLAIIADLHIGAGLKLHDLEFILKHSYRPPYVTLLSRNFNIVPRADTTQTDIPPALRDHKGVRNTLSMWQDFEESRTMDSEHDSPQSIRSQVGAGKNDGNDSDTENQDPSLASQEQFATQIPLRKTPNKHGRHENLIESSKVPDKHQRAEHVNPVKVRNSFKTSSNGAADNGNGAQRNNDELSPSSGLTQKQIIVPPASAPVEETESGNTLKHGTSTQSQDGTSSLSTKKDRFTIPEPIPDSVIELLRTLRKDCKDSRYVPRHLQVIPKSQAKLLDLDDRWQPPLVGRVQRPGAVPLDLLNHLTEEADRTHTVELPIQAEPPLPVTSQRIDMHDKARMIREDLLDPSDIESHSSRIEWSSSPLQAPLHRTSLPPDSSPPKPTDSQVGHVDMSQLDKRANPTKLAVTTLAVDSVLRRFNTRSPENDNIPVGVSADTKESTLLPPSTSRKHSKMNHVDPPKTIQVKRTPYHVRKTSPAKEIPQSSAVVIPATFDEGKTARSTEAIRNTRVAACSLDRVLVNEYDVQGKNNFEMDTSEDEIAVRRGRSNIYIPQSTASGLREAEVRIRSKDRSIYDRQSTHSIKSSTKRKINEQSSRPPKRVKSSDRLATSERISTSEYDGIDQNRTLQRREILGRIGKRRDPMEQAPLIRPALIEAEKASSLASRLADTEAWGSSPLYKMQVNTSDTHASIYQSMDNLAKESVLEQLDPTVSGSNTLTPAELYSKFKHTYPGYGGQEKHFDAACQILKSLHLQEKATHQLLWDDFVFRHFHDYRNYLRDVMENSGDALPYEKFYREYIEQPTCLQRLIRPAYISQMAPGPASRGRFSLGPSSSIAPENPHIGVIPNTVAAAARSIAVESSVSNIVVEKDYYQSPLQQVRQPENVRVGELEYEDTSSKPPKELSQESRSSVKIWLERAAGAESPILGTQEASTNRDMDIPTLELATAVPDASRTRSTPAQQQKKGQSSLQRKANGLESPQSCHDTGGSQTASSVSKRKVRHCQDSKTNPTRITAVKARPLEPMSESAAVHSDPGKSGNGNQSGALETAFTRFTAFYRALPGERRALKHQEADASKAVNIFSWRR